MWTAVHIFDALLFSLVYYTYGDRLRFINNKNLKLNILLTFLYLSIAIDRIIGHLFHSHDLKHNYNNCHDSEEEKWQKLLYNLIKKF